MARAGLCQAPSNIDSLKAQVSTPDKSFTEKCWPAPYVEVTIGFYSVDRPENGLAGSDNWFQESGEIPIRSFSAPRSRCLALKEKILAGTAAAAIQQDAGNGPRPVGSLPCRRCFGGRRFRQQGTRARPVNLKLKIAGGSSGPSPDSRLPGTLTSWTERVTNFVLEFTAMTLNLEIHR